MDARNPKCIDEIHESAEDLRQHLDSVTRETAILKAARQPNRMLSLHEHLKPAVRDLIDRHTDGVRADVDDCMQHQNYLFSPLPGTGTTTR